MTPNHPPHIEKLYLELYAQSGNVTEFNKILLVIRQERDKKLNLK